MRATTADLDSSASSICGLYDCVGRARPLQTNGNRDVLPTLLTCFRVICESRSGKMPIAARLTRFFHGQVAMSGDLAPTQRGCPSASQFRYFCSRCPTNPCILNDTIITFGVQRQSDDFYCDVFHGVRLWEPVPAGP